MLQCIDDEKSNRSVSDNQIVLHKKARRHKIPSIQKFIKQYRNTT